MSRILEQRTVRGTTVITDRLAADQAAAALGCFEPAERVDAYGTATRYRLAGNRYGFMDLRNDVHNTGSFTVGYDEDYARQLEEHVGAPVRDANGQITQLAPVFMGRYEQFAKLHVEEAAARSQGLAFLVDTAEDGSVVTYTGEEGTSQLELEHEVLELKLRVGA